MDLNVLILPLRIDVAD
ncbi:hypothetical protein VCHC42A1_2329, partial [Vibrio cholerae HC-42A1]